MTAGVLNFRLCDRGLDCRHCPLERALRNAPDTAERTPEPGPRHTTPGGCEVPKDLYYHPGHTWVRLLPGGEFEVGIDDLGSRVLGPVERVELPEKGDAPVRIETRGVTVSLRPPFSGHLSGTNSALHYEPGLIGSAPYGAGFLYRARPAEPSRALSGLMAADKALAWTADQELLLRALVDVATARAGEHATLNDGGLLSDDLLAGVPPVKAERIREWIFNAPQTGREARER
jgi:glycine cleavage system H lipoate-binding protein